MFKTVITILIFSGLSLCATKGEQIKIELRAQCDTPQTGFNGIGRTCSSGWEFQTAPKGFVIDKGSIKIDITSRGGRDNRCHLEFEDFVKIIPDVSITQPRTMKVKASALSNKGSKAAKGWTHCKYTGHYVGYE